MEKIKNSVYELDSALMELDILKSISFLLWTSMAEGSVDVDEVYILAAYKLQDMTKEVAEKLRGISKDLLDGLEGE